MARTRPENTREFRLLRRCRRVMLAVGSSHRDPNVWSGRASQEVLSIWRLCGLASMYSASRWSLRAPGHHGYQRACDLISGQASTGPFGSPVFACAGKTDPPSRLILSQTSAGNGRWDYVIAGSLSVQFLCSCRAAVPSSRPVLVSRAPRTGAVKAGRRAWAFGAGFPGHGFDDPGHGITLKRIGTPSRLS
jgi:hypothetical protein